MRGVTDHIYQLKMTKFFTIIMGFLAIISSLCIAFTNRRVNIGRTSRFAILASPDDTAVSSFDLDFADAISKPLPEWYKDQVEEQQKENAEIQANRDKILKQFKDKYEVKDENQKIEEFKNRKQKGSNWMASLFSTPKRTGEGDERTTKEKWEEFLEDERRDTGFYLPGFFEVFPELKLKWPVWSKRKDGSVMKCETDSDCQFPQACCPHPILPGDKFCCTGFGRRILVPAYQTRRIVASQGPPPPPPGPRDGKPF